MLMFVELPEASSLYSPCVAGVSIAVENSVGLQLKVAGFRSTLAVMSHIAP